MSDQEKSKSKKIELKWVHYIYEFFIVVIGISVPFMLSKCNENNILKNTEKAYLETIKDELVLDSGAINGNLDLNNRLIDNVTEMLVIIENNDRESKNILASKSIDLLEFSDFHKRSSLYESLANSGELDIMTNLELVRRLGQLDELYTYINRVEDTNLEVNYVFFPKLSENIQFNPIEAVEEEKLYDYQFHNWLLIYRELYIEKDSLYNEALIDLREIITLIDEGN